MRPTTKKLLAISLAGSMALAACGGDDDMDMAEGETAGTETGAAALRAGLISLLQEHVYLAGIAIETALDAGGDMEAPAVQAAVDQALTDLEGYQQAAGDFFEEITAGELPAEALVESLDEHVATLTTAIDSLIASEPSVFDDLRAAGQHMPMAAAALAGAIVAATS